jgi:hypothetical protein
LAVLAVVACGREAAPEASKAEGPPPPAAEIPAADEIGSFGARVSTIAYWNHPSIPFNGLVLVGGGSGLLALNVEDGAEVARVDDLSVRTVDVAYIGSGASAQGYAVVSVDSDSAPSPGVRVYAIDNETRALTLLSSLFVAGQSESGAFCLTSKGDQVVLHHALASGLIARPLSITEGMVTSGDARSSNFDAGFVACAGDELDGAVFAVNAAGDIYRADADGEISAKPFAESGVANPAGIGVALNGLVEGGPTDACCGQVAVLNGADGSVHLFDRDDGRALGVVKIKASFDVDGVHAATAMGVGYGNFGAVYRDGILALATNGEAPAVRLAPLNGAMDALSIPIGPAANPRDLTPQAEEDVLDFAVEPPSP